MRNKAIIYHITIWIFILFVPYLCIAYDDGRTHPHIMKDAIDGSGLHSFLQQYFNLEEYVSGLGPDTRLNEKSVAEILREGSKKEDDPSCRAANHFHNPIATGTTWDEGKLTDPHWLINWACENFLPPDSEDHGIDYPSEDATSNLTWGTGFISLEQKDLFILDKNKWDWESAREYYFTAVTGLMNDDFDFILAGDEGQKNGYLEKTLKAVGYVAHLLQDTSVPAHVRNDFSQGHTMFLPSFDIPKKWVVNSYEKYLRRNNNNLAAFKEPPIRSEQVNYRLTDFWDTNQFNSEFDGVGIDMNSFGLAEYTNLNFFSDFSRFSTDFPFPKKEHTTIIYDKPNGFSLFNRKYYATTVAHPGEQIQHLSTVSALYHYLSIYVLPIGTIIPPRKFLLYFDSKCYDEYAKHLIPRAIGFSADLIDYFFRGRIEISPILPQDLEVRGNGSGDVSISKINASLKNVTNEIKGPDDNPLFSNENMQEGSLYAVAKYEMDEVVKYSLSKRIYLRLEDNNFINDTTPSEYEFDFSKEPIPWHASNIAIQVVFRGTLGTEEDIAVAVGRQPLFAGKMEITPPSKYIYSFFDGADIYDDMGILKPKVFSTLKASLFNRVEGKEIHSGELTAIAVYKKRTNYKADLSADPPSADDRENVFSYSYSTPVIIDPDTNPINSASASEFEFNFSSDPIPPGITDLYLYMVFKGILHNPLTQTNEPDSLVVGIKDINESQHLTFWNDTDYFLLNRIPVKAGDIENDPDVELYGYIYPHDITESIALLETKPTDTVPALFNFDLEPGHYSRIVVLTDSPGMYALSDLVVAPDNPIVPPEGFTYNFFLPRTINQLNSDGLWYKTPVPLNRGIYQHNWSFFINIYPAYQFEFQSPMPVPDNDLKPIPASSVYFP